MVWLHCTDKKVKADGIKSASEVAKAGGARTLEPPSGTLPITACHPHRILRLMLRGAVKSRSPEMPRVALQVACGFSLLLYLPFSCYLVFFQVKRERKKITAPQVVPAHLFWGLWKPETRVDLLNHNGGGRGRKDRSVGSGHRLSDWVEK